MTTRDAVPYPTSLDDVHSAEWCEHSRLVVVAGQMVDGHVLVAAVGALCAPGGDSLLRLTEQLITAGVRRVDLDLFAVSAADLCGVRALSDMQAALNRAGAELRITQSKLDVFPIDWHPISSDATPETIPLAQPLEPGLAAGRITRTRRRLRAGRPTNGARERTE